MSVINGKRTETTESVRIKNGKGVKEVVKRVNGKTRKSSHKLSPTEIQNVMDRKFMPEFFVPCHEGCDRALLQLPPPPPKRQRPKRQRLTRTKKPRTKKATK